MLILNGYRKTLKIQPIAFVAAQQEGVNTAAGLVSALY